MEQELSLIHISIMELCQERRGQYLGMEYMEETRALLKYELPLNEIIYDFFDALKSRSKGCLLYTSIPQQPYRREC